MPTYSGLNYLAQAASAARIMQECDEYARSIGCVVQGGEIHCTPAQAALMAKWWQTRTASRELAKFGMRVTNE